MRVPSIRAPWLAAALILLMAGAALAVDIVRPTVLTQTPQVFRLDLLRKAFRKAEEDEFVGTDESSLVERLETVEVVVVAGSDRNLKITKPSDMELARFFLAEERDRTTSG